jgi:uncharacterized protein
MRSSNTLSHQPLGVGAAALGLCASLALLQQPALGDQPQPPTITVTDTSSVSYAPDIADFTLGVRADAPDAASAAQLVNANAQAVINALGQVGISNSNISTSGYEIEYHPAPAPSAAPPIDEVTTQSTARKAIPPQGSYVALESIDVAAPIGKVGQVLDAAIAAGANESTGMSFDTSQRDALYRQALSKAMNAARDEAMVLAKAAKVNIAGIQSIEAQGQYGGSRVIARVMVRALTPGVLPPIQGGTGTIDATVTVVYRIK